MSKESIIRKPIIKLETADKQASRPPVGERRSTIDFHAALAFAEAKAGDAANAVSQTGLAEGHADGSPSAPMGSKSLTINLDQWLNKQLGLLALAQETTVDEIIGDLVRKHLAKNGSNVGSRGIKVRARDSES